MIISLKGTMSNAEKMTIDERRKYLRVMKERYVKAGRKARKQLLDEMEAVTGLDRKTLIRLMKGSLQREPWSRERGTIYGVQVDDALRVIYESSDYICAERLTPNLAWPACHLATHGELEVTPVLLEQLEAISVSTVERRLQRIRQDQPRLPRPKPKPGSKLLQGIPMLRLPWAIAVPGHFETDLVHHCGDSASDEYGCTLQMIDVATVWSERRAVLGRSYLVMEDAFHSILARLPFPVLQIRPDNGSEFFNHRMLRFWGDVVQGVTISRSRPFTRMTILESSRRTAPSCGLTWVMSASTPSLRCWPSMPCMTRCGSSTTSSSPSCGWRRRSSSQVTTPSSPRSSAATTMPAHPSTACVIRRPFPAHAVSHWTRCAIAPTHASCGKRSMTGLSTSVPCPKQCPASPRMCI